MRHWPLAVAMVLLLAVTTGLLLRGLSMTGGGLVYPLDDTYILMAMAKNFGLHGVWSTSPVAFGSTSSSLLFTAILALAYRLFGDSVFTPLLLNVLFAGTLMTAVYWVLRAFLRSSRAVFVWLLGIGLVIPLPLLILSGNEHLLQATVSVLFLFVGARMLGEGPGEGRHDRVWIVLLAPLVTTARFEGLFLVFVVGLLFLVRHRVRTAVAFGAAALLPIGAFGLYSLAQGWYFLPNSVLLKGQVPEASLYGVSRTLVGWYGNLTGNSHLLVLFVMLLAALLAVLHARRTLWRADALMLLIALVMGVWHIAFARIGHFYRYEAYLLAMGLVAVASCWGLASDALTRWRGEVGGGSLIAVFWVLLIVAAAPLLGRAKASALDVPWAMRNIHQQQIQMAEFLRRHYPGGTVAVNDIGAISYFTDLHVVDLWGLATLEAAQAKRAGTYDVNTVDRIAREGGAKVAIIYDEWFRRWGGVPKNWQKVGTWEIANNVVCGDKVVSFYAVDLAEAGDLTAHLSEFAAELPQDVKHVLLAQDR